MTQTTVCFIHWSPSGHCLHGKFGAREADVDLKNMMPPVLWIQVLCFWPMNLLSYATTYETAPDQFLSLLVVQNLSPSTVLNMFSLSNCDFSSLHCSSLNHWSFHLYLPISTLSHRISHYSLFTQHDLIFCIWRQHRVQNMAHNIYLLNKPMYLKVFISKEHLPLGLTLTIWIICV